MRTSSARVVVATRAARVHKLVLQLEMNRKEKDNFKNWESRPSASTRSPSPPSTPSGGRQMELRIEADETSASTWSPSPPSTPSGVPPSPLPSDDVDQVKSDAAACASPCFNATSAALTSQLRGSSPRTHRSRLLLLSLLFSSPHPYPTPQTGSARQKSSKSSKRSSPRCAKKRFSPPRSARRSDRSC